MTGETGAGKSIIIDAINTVLGTKVQKESIRTGADSASVTAVFYLGNSGLAEKIRALDLGIELDDGGELVLFREISAGGRSSARLNGKIVPISVIRAVSERIIDLHGQHDNHSLLKKEKHIDLLDNYGGTVLNQLKEQYAVVFAEYHHVAKTLETLRKNEAERVRNIDLLNYQIQEIRNARLKPNEDEQLREEITRLANAEKISKALAGAYSALSESGGDGSDGRAAARENIGTGLHFLNAISSHSQCYAELFSRLQELSYQLEDINAAIRQEQEETRYQPAKLDQLYERTEAIDSLKKKYGGSIKAIHQYYINAQQRLAAASNSEQQQDLLKGQLAALRHQMLELAAELTECRRGVAAVVEGRIVAELTALEMGQARFEVQIQAAETVAEYHSKGRDRVEFLFSANPGEECKPLAKIASGGEMSRIMLAVKSVLADTDHISTMIFDEIDTGISGKAASRVAEKMYLLSRGCQIICVTHQAQIACMADQQILIEKWSTDERTHTKVSALAEEDRIAEISRLLGGDAQTEASIRLAKELRQRSEQFKTQG